MFTLKKNNVCQGFDESSGGMVIDEISNSIIYIISQWQSA